MPSVPYYLKDGTRVPGVTTVLGKRKDPGGLMWWAWDCGVRGIDYRKQRDDAADAGTLAHAMVEEHVHGRDPYALLKQDTFTGIGRPYTNDPEVQKLAEVAFESYLGWERQKGIEIVETEFPLVSETHRFGGCPDALGRIGGRLILLDWKSSNSVYADHIIQLAAYRQLHNENRDEVVEEAQLVRFGKKHGDFRHYQFVPSQLDLAWDTFLHLREVYDLDRQLAKMVA